MADPKEIEPENENGMADKFLRAIMILGASALHHHAENPGIFRASSTVDVRTLGATGGIEPVKGTKPSAAKTVAESTYRHLRPGGNARIKGSDRISWSTKLKELVAMSKTKGTPIYKLDVKKLRALKVQLYTPAELLKHLAAYRAELNASLKTATGSNKINRLRRSLEALKRAEDYVGKYNEHHTVGRVPKAALTTVDGQKALRKVRIARGFGYALIGLSIFLAGKRVMDTEPERRAAVFADEAAGLVFDLILPGAGPIATYAVQTSRGELKLMSQLFPTAFTWILDAYGLSDALEQADPEGARYIRKSLQTEWGTYQMLIRMFGAGY